jgi:hypothetical protein
MKTRRHKLPAKKALPSATEAPMAPNVAPEADAGEDEEQLVRTSEAAHRLNVSENTVRKYMQLGLLDRVLIGTRTVRMTRGSLSRLMGQQAAE